MQYNTYSHRLHTLEWLLSLVAAFIAAIAATPFVNIDPAATAAVLVTLGGVAVSHSEAARFDKLIPIYRSTANQLGNIKLRRLAGETESVDRVMECETALAAEYSTWSVLWMES